MDYSNKDFSTVFPVDKTRVVFYARVSTESEEQQHSIESQQEYFTQFIKNNKNWILVDKYIDKGITGTNVNKRPDFLRMVRDADKGKFDLILTKEVSRFARNTIDTLRYTRKFKKLNIGVIFTLDNINTLDNDGELRLSIMATLAQEEARRTSERVRWEHKKLMEEGVAFGSNNILGYNVENGKLTINENEAETVKLIYDLYLQGMGARAIQIELQKRGIKTPTGNKIWRHPVIMYILKNEKYIGKLVQKKTLTLDYLDKKRKRNKGEEDFIVIDNNHEPIISEDIFYKVQKEIKRRKNLAYKGVRHTNKYVYSGKLKCFHCGKNLNRITWNTLKDGTKTYAWQCNSRREFGKKTIIDREVFGCDSKGIPEKLLNEVIKLTIKKLLVAKDDLFYIINETLNEIIKNNSFISEVSEINNSIKNFKNKLDVLIEMRTDGEINKEEFLKKKQEYESYIKKQEKTLSQYNDLIQSSTNKYERFNKFKEVFDSLSNFEEDKVHDEAVNYIFDHIVVYDKQNFDLYLNFGINIPVKFKDGGIKILPFGHNSGYCNNQSVVDTKPLISFTITRDMIALPMNIKKHWNNISVNIFAK